MTVSVITRHREHCAMGIINGATENPRPDIARPSKLWGTDIARPDNAAPD